MTAEFAATLDGPIIDIRTEGLKAAGSLPRWAPTIFRKVSALRYGRLTAVLPDGRAIAIRGDEPGPHGIMLVKDNSLWRRMIFGGDIGYAEAYMEGKWESPDVAAIVETLALNMHVFNDFVGHPIQHFAQRMIHKLRANTRTGSRRNIAYHYDLGNAFYERWLDPTMTYSAAVFTQADQDLADAQREKYARLCRSMDLQAGQSVLEIGCGWGGFAEFAAKEVGARVTGITISPSQHEFARKRMFEQGLADKVDIQLCDYRDTTGTYDRVASIEMFEAVGEKFWPVYFDTVRDRLKPGGRGGLQIITIHDDFFEAYRTGADFIQRYIFPGGMLPSPTVLRRSIEAAGMQVTSNDTFGKDYARTIDHWHRDFVSAWPILSRQGFDERFRRMWIYYLAYCAGGFRAGNIDVCHVGIARP